MPDETTYKYIRKHTALEVEPIKKLFSAFSHKDQDTINPDEFIPALTATAPYITRLVSRVDLIKYILVAGWWPSDKPNAIGYRKRSEQCLFSDPLWFEKWSADCASFLDAFEQIKDADFDEPGHSTIYHAIDGFVTATANLSASTMTLIKSAPTPRYPGEAVVSHIDHFGNDGRKRPWDYRFITPTTTPALAKVAIAECLQVLGVPGELSESFADNITDLYGSEPMQAWPTGLRADWVKAISDFKACSLDGCSFNRADGQVIGKTVKLLMASVYALIANLKITKPEPANA